MTYTGLTYSKYYFKAMPAIVFLVNFLDQKQYNLEDYMCNGHLHICKQIRVPPKQVIVHTK